MTEQMDKTKTKKKKYFLFHFCSDLSVLSAFSYCRFFKQWNLTHNTTQ